MSADNGFNKAFQDAVHIAAPLRWDGYKMNAFIDYPHGETSPHGIGQHAVKEAASLQFGQNPMKLARFYFYLQRNNKDYPFPYGIAPVDYDDENPFVGRWSLFYLMFFETERLSFPSYFRDSWDGIEEWQWSNVISGPYYQRIRVQVLRELCGFRAPGKSIAVSPYSTGQSCGFYSESMKESHWIGRYHPSPGYTLALSFKANAYAELITGKKDPDAVSGLVEKTVGRTGLQSLFDGEVLPIPDDAWAARFIFFLLARYLMEVESNGRDPMSDETVMLRLFALLYLRFYREGLDPSRLTRNRFRRDWEDISFAERERLAGMCRKILIETRNETAKRFYEECCQD